MATGAAIQPSRTAARSSRSARTPSLMLDALSIGRSGASRRAPPGQPEARRAAGAERYRREEHDPVGARHVVDDATEPWADRPADSVPDAERAVDHAEAAPAEEVRGHRGDDRAARAKTETEDQRVRHQPADARIALERQQRQRAGGGAPERERRRQRAADAGVDRGPRARRAGARSPGRPRRGWQSPRASRTSR